MSQVVQAACPGCNSVLRIPVDWLGQPIRCKNCGATMQAKAPPAAVVPPKSAAKRGSAPPPPPSQVRPAAPVRPATSGQPHARLENASPFAFDTDEEITAPTPRRGRSRRKKGSGNWIAIVAAMLILGMTAGACYLVYTQVIKPRQEEVVQSEEEASGTARQKTGKNNAGDGPAVFPRRALIISVHNYLYANPISVGDNDTPNIERLRSSLNRGLRIPLNQIIHLSDAAKKDPRPPLKSVIEQGLKNFLATTRKQDRIMVFFIGHTKEIDDEAYLVPLEGELDNKDTLIPLKWVFEQLQQCPARQKVLVLDGNRTNPGQGEERPASGPMGEKFEATLKSPPAGVQVWSACSAGQQSIELSDSALGLFLDSLRVGLTPEKGAKGALDGKIQSYDDLLPLEQLQTFVKERVEAVSTRRKTGNQVVLLAGQAPQEGAAFDRTEPPAPIPALPNVQAGDLSLVKAILNEISVPPLKGGETASDDVSFELLPPFPESVMKQYFGTDLPADSKLRQAVAKARAALWAASTAKPPSSLQDEVKQMRAAMRFDLSIMRDRYGIPPPSDVERFKASILSDLEPMARIIKRMEDVIDELKAVADEREEAPKRWQANYDFILARCQASLAYMEDYQGQLGQLRRDLPEHDPEIHTEFRLASSEKATDTAGKKLERAARKLYSDLAKAHPQTPWEVLAKRERLTALGLVWKSY